MTAPISAAAPITQDVLTIPRKTPEGGKPNLVGMTRDQMRAALIAAGTPEKTAKMRLGQVWQWIYFWGVRDFDRDLAHPLAHIRIDDRGGRFFDHLLMAALHRAFALAEIDCIAVFVR